MKMMRQLAFPPSEFKAFFTTLEIFKGLRDGDKNGNRVCAR